MNKLTIKEIDKQFVENIRFCWISYSGCLGPSGFVFFMDNKGIIYSCNYDNKQSEEYICPEELCKRCKNYGLNLDLTRITAIEGWDSFYLGGCGNYLYVCPKYALDFYRFAYDRSTVELFENWKEVARYIMRTQKSTS